MALLQTQRTAQTVLCASFPVNFANGDTMANVNGKVVPISTNIPADSVFEIIKLPIGAVILGVGIDISVSTSTTAYASVGTRAAPNAFINSTNLNATPTRVESTAAGGANVTAGIQTSGENLVLTLTNSGNSQVGAFVVDVRYYILNRASEVIGA